MKLESDGILISMRPLNERDALGRVFSCDFGIIAGVLRGAVLAKKNKPLVGQVGHAVWNARLDSQLGTFHWEGEKNIAAGLMQNPAALMAMNTAFCLIDVLLPEREAYSDLFDATMQLINDLLVKNTESCYLNWEQVLLRELGYALDLSHCSGCGCGDGLNYLSPRTGRAVCDVCAQPYVDKLYKLPLNLDITRRFVDNVCMQQGVQMPMLRTMMKKS